MATPKRPLTDDEFLLQYARQQTGNNPTMSRQDMVTLGLNTAAGVPPVAPGYDINPTIRSAQAAEDRAMQARATAPLTVNTGIGADPDVPVTPDMARAARIGRQDPDVPVVRTPTVAPTAALDTNPSIRAAQVEGSRAADIAELSPENQAVIAQDRANLKSAVDALNKNFDTFKVNAPAAPAGPTYANERGNYNIEDTSPDVIADAARRAYTGSGGVNFGFAPGGARQYLDSMALQDDARAQRRAAIQADVERIGLRNAMQSGTVAEAAAARRQMEALDTRINLGTQQLGETTRQRISTAGDVQRAGLAAQASEAAAMADARSKREAAQLTGEYGLAAAREKAAGATQAELTKAMSPQGQLAAQRAALIQQQILLAQQAAAAGDVGGTYAAYGLSRPNEKVYTDPVTGAPLSQEQIAILQQQQLQRLQQTQ